MQIVIDFFREFWQTCLQMAPWLLFGFLMAGLVSVLFSPGTVMRLFGRERGWRAILTAVVIGVPLPLCSCGVLPVAAGLRKQGAGRGAVAAFLVATPQVGVDSIIATGGMMGWFFAITRPVSAILTGLVGGTLVDRFTRDASSAFTPDAAAPTAKKSLPGSLAAIIRYAFLTLARSIARPLLLGLTLSALITLFVPEDFFLSGLASTDWVAMPVMLVIGLPMYICSTASIPVALALIGKGLSPGAALVFLIVGPALNAASLTTLFKILGRTGALIHLTVVAGGALLSGIALNAINSFHSVLPANLCAGAACHTAEGATPPFAALCAVFLLALIAWHITAPFFTPKKKSCCSAPKDDPPKKSGGCCGHC